MILPLISCAAGVVLRQSFGTWQGLVPPADRSGSLAEQGEQTETLKLLTKDPTSKPPSCLLNFTNRKEVIPNLFTPLDLLPPQPRHVHHAHDHRTTPALVGKEPTKLRGVDVFVPVVRALGNDAQHVLGHEVCREPARPRARNGAHHQPPARFDKGSHALEEGGWLVDVLDDLEQRDDVVAVARQRKGELFDGRLLVLELGA
ncbi:hypothetical protein G7046_g7511 [Stylonectria norvegica]|nr:hypothetical protein G7046_g7511 [Stylonectria norvegica]